MVDHLFEVPHVAHVRAEDVAVLAGDAVALDHLWRALRQLGDILELSRRRADPDDRAQSQPERPGVDVGVVAADHAELLEALDALRHCR